MQCEFDAETRLEIASMVYNRWCIAFDKLKEVKALTWESAGKFCPKADWPSFHSDMIKTADKEMQLATRLKDSVCKYSPLIIGS